MYEFEHILPFLPVEHRRQMCFSILGTYWLMVSDPGAREENDFLQIAAMYQVIQRRDMKMCEERGLTNTSVNPFDIWPYPPPLIGG